MNIFVVCVVGAFTVVLIASVGMSGTDFFLSRLTLIGCGERVERFLIVGKQRGRGLEVFIPCALSI